MNASLVETDIPESLAELIQEIETYCGFEITLELDPFLRARGMLTSSPTSIIIKVKTAPANLAVVTHELCHARRYYNRKTWMMEFVPPRFFGIEATQLNAAENLDNVLEHLFIIQEMEEEFGYPKDDSHVIEDLNFLEEEQDKFYRRSILLTTWLLCNYHFPYLLDRAKRLLEVEELLPTAESLLSDARKAGNSKAKLVEAFVKALGIPEGEVRLRHRDPKANGLDVGAMLLDVLAEESNLASTVGITAL